MAAASRTLSKSLDDIAECPICMEVFSDPRTLPCVHTYCLKCIDKHVNSEIISTKKPTCPVCRAQFTLPAGGVQCLPKNFYMDRFQNLRGLSSKADQEVPCEACSGQSDADGGTKKVAAMYCIDCEQRLCESCDEIHKNLRAMRSHRSFRLGEVAPSLKLHVSYCEKHRDDVVKLYCNDCNEVLCLVCFAESHNAHRCVDVGKAADHFRKNMKADTECLASGISACQYLQRLVADGKTALVDDVIKSEKEICDEATRLKIIVKRRKNELLRQLKEVKQNRSKELDALDGEIEHHVSLMESLKKYNAEICDNGTSGDIAKQVNFLHRRTEELLRLDALYHSVNNSGSLRIEIRSTDVQTFCAKSVGEIDIKRVKYKVKVADAPTSIGVIGVGSTFEITWSSCDVVGTTNSPIVNYEIEMLESNSVAWVPCAKVYASDEYIHVIDEKKHRLTVGSGYKFRVRGVSLFGAGNWKESEICCHRQLIPIFVKMNSGGRLLTLYVEPNGTIMSLKNMIEARESLPASQQNLKTLTGKTLDNVRTLNDYFIQRNSTLYCSLMRSSTEEDE